MTLQNCHEAFLVKSYRPTLLSAASPSHATIDGDYFSQVALFFTGGVVSELRRLRSQSPSSNITMYQFAVAPQSSAPAPFVRLYFKLVTLAASEGSLYYGTPSQLPSPHLDKLRTSPLVMGINDKSGFDPQPTSQIWAWLGLSHRSILFFVFHWLYLVRRTRTLTQPVRPTILSKSFVTMNQEYGRLVLNGYGQGKRQS